MTVYSIAARLPFADSIAAHLIAEAGDDPLGLAAMTLLVPARRARRTLREAFLRRSGGRPLVLPRLIAVGDLDEDEALFAGFAGAGIMGEGGGLAEAADLPPAIPALRRQILLTRLILARGGETVDQAARLAGELASLLDQVQTEDLGFERLAQLVPEKLASHWQVTLDFLRIVTDVWPAVLAEAGCLDPADRRNRLLRLQAEAWRRQPPAGPVIAAGINGSMPAARDLLITVANLPRGRVVLAGLDRHLDDEGWQAVEPSHPQYALKQALDALNLDRAEVLDWPSAPEGRTPPGREALLSEVLRPAATTHRWREIGPLDPDALRGVTRIDCPTPREEALTVALMLRNALETPDRTAALVTPDRDLARRVTAELRRWDITADDSAGRPLMVTAPGAFLRLVAAMAADAFGPVSTLSVLKHPLCGLGMATAPFRDLVRRLETDVLRGVRPGPGIAGLRAALTAARRNDPPLFALLDTLEALTAPLATLMAGGPVPLATLIEGHMRAAEALAATDDTAGPLRLWAGDAGDAAAEFVRSLSESAAPLDALAPPEYPAVFDTLMVGQSVRPEFGSHPRLSIFGPLEARLQHADVMIVGGLNDDGWPPRPLTDPWMSRPMRRDFGLPLPEMRIGLAAHDFAGLLGSPEVILTRSLKVDGTPTVASRWLLRLDAVLKAGGLALPAEAPWLPWALLVDQPEGPPSPIGRPAPRPPVSARPARLSVTQIETWMRDPYGLYAQQVLGLRRLDPLDAEPGPSEYGTLVHAALEAFLRQFPKDLPDDAEEHLIRCGDAAFADLIARPAVQAFWGPRFRRLAAWVVAHERSRRAGVQESVLEQRGEMAVGAFTLTAKADRIDLMRDGSLAVIDYKTGKPPSAREVAAGYAPQLPLEAAIAAEGGFPGVPKRAAAQLLYWWLRGAADEGGLETSAGSDPATLVTEAVDGLRALIAVFNDPETPYLSRPHPSSAPAYSDYQHLARVKEWAAGGGDGDGE